MVENMLRRSAHARERGGDIQEAMLLGAREVARPVAFGVGIILLVYIPILTLQGTEGKMFRPMALTVMFAVAAALVLALTLIPAATTLALPRGGNEKDTWLLRKIRGAYEPTLDLCLRRPWLTAAVAAAVFAASLGVLPFLGSEFIPRLDEGDLVIQAWRLPSISLEESVRTTLEIEKTLKRFPEVRRVISRTGTPEVATDVMGMELSDIFVNLRPPSEWTTARDKEELIEKMREALEREVPGVGFGFTQPIEMRFNELIAGVRSDVALKIFGDDLDELRVAAGRAAAVLSRIPGAEDVRVEQTAGQSVVSVRVDRARIARHGLDDERVLRAVEAAGAGRVVGRVFEGRRQFDLVVRLAGRDGQASGPQALADVPIAAGEAGLLPLGQLASVEIEDAPAQVSREAASRRIVIECNVRGRDLGSFVEEARAAIEREVPLPPGYFTRWGGQFENLERGRARLFVAVPIALMLIFALLYLAFGSARPALLVYVNVPLAATGGLLALAARGMPLSISAGVGFIALFGVAVLNGVVMISHVRRLSAQGVAPGEAARQGAMDRLRPVLMTALVASFGFVPMAISTSAGAEVQRPLATVVIGGLVTSTLLTLLVLPAIYKWFSERRVEVVA
jgi:cobalt-zinc-cadmium resistance protein CzcA